MRTKRLLVCLAVFCALNYLVACAYADIIKGEDGELEIVEEKSQAEELIKDMKEMQDLEAEDSEQGKESRLERELGKYDERKIEQALNAELSSQLGITEKDIFKNSIIELFVKLKAGRALADILALNDKYQVISVTKMFSDNPAPEEILAELKAKLLRLIQEAHPWQWEWDKESQEYQERLSQLKEEKIALIKQITAQKRIMANAKETRKGVAKGAPLPRTRNLYLLKADKEANIFLMMQDYMNNPSVEYVEPRYKDKEEEK